MQIINIKMFFAEEDKTLASRLVETISSFSDENECFKKKELIKHLVMATPDKFSMSIKSFGENGKIFHEVILNKKYTSFKDCKIEKANKFKYLYKKVKTLLLDTVTDKFDVFINDNKHQIEEIKFLLLSNNKIAIKSGLTMTFTNVNSIIMIESQKNKTLIHTRDGTIETPELIGSIYSKLNFPNFIRCHKSFIINLNYITEIKYLENRTYEVRFNYIKTYALVSRTKTKELFELLKIDN